MTKKRKRAHECIVKKMKQVRGAVPEEEAPIDGRKDSGARTIQQEAAAPRPLEGLSVADGRTEQGEENWRFSFITLRRTKSCLPPPWRPEFSA